MREFEKSAGFTLIELLTVIAIVGVLAAILIPVVGSVRIKASSSVSVSNLRQINTGINLYANDHNGALPGPIYSSQGPRFNLTDPTNLAAMLEPYLDSEYQSSKYGYARIFSYPAWESNTPDLNGPSYQVKRSPFKNKQLKPLGENRPDPKDVRGPMTLIQMASHDTKGLHWIHEIDKQYPNIGSPGWISKIPDAPVHVNHRNVLMLDGSVQSIPLEDF